MQVGLRWAGHRWERIKRLSVVTDRHGVVVEPLASVVLQVCRCNGDGGRCHTLGLDSCLDECIRVVVAISNSNPLNYNVQLHHYLSILILLSVCVLGSPSQCTEFHCQENKSIIKKIKIKKQLLE